MTAFRRLFLGVFIFHLSPPLFAAKAHAGTSRSETPRRKESPGDNGVRKNPEINTRTEKKPVEHAHSLGLSVTGGYEARYGNSLALLFMPAKWFELSLGGGYNNSGPKVGAGADVVLFVSKSVGIPIGGAFVYSLGRKGTVTQDADFKPDGSGSSQKITATKSYTLSPAELLNASTGVLFEITDTIRLRISIGYNVVLGGNEVIYDNDTKYDPNVQITNEAEFSKEFDTKAADIVKAGGFGASLGMEFLF